MCRRRLQFSPTDRFVEPWEEVAPTLIPFWTRSALTCVLVIIVCAFDAFQLSKTFKIILQAAFVDDIGASEAQMTSQVIGRFFCQDYCVEVLFENVI